MSPDTTTTLTQGDLRKEGSAYDLPMAIGILASKGIIPQANLEETLFLGELALDGGLKPVRAVLACSECAQNQALKRIVLPQENTREANLVQGIEVLGATNLAQVVNFLLSVNYFFPLTTIIITVFLGQKMGRR